MILYGLVIFNIVSLLHCNCYMLLLVAWVANHFAFSYLFYPSTHFMFCYSALRVFSRPL